MRNSPSLKSQKGLINLELLVPESIKTIWGKVKTGANLYIEDSLWKKYHDTHAQEIGLRMVRKLNKDINMYFPDGSPQGNPIYPELSYAPQVVRFTTMNNSLSVDRAIKENPPYLRLVGRPVIAVAPDIKIDQPYIFEFSYKRWLQDNITDSVLRDSFGLDK